MKNYNKVSKQDPQSGDPRNLFDYGKIAFGNPLDLIEKRQFIKQYDKEYNAMYAKKKKEKDRSKILRKNESL